MKREKRSKFIIFKFIAAILLIFFVHINIEGVTIDKDWSKHYGTENYDNMFRIRPSGDDGYLILGETYGSVGNTENLGRTDAWILKIDNDGNEIWSKQYGGTDFDTLVDIIPTKDGNYMVCGYTSGDVGSTSNLGDNDGWLLKIDKDGKEIWSKQYGNAFYNSFSSIIALKNGDYLISGSSVGMQGEGNLGARDGWLLRVDKDGKEIWSKAYGGTKHDDLHEIIPTKDGNYLANGSTFSHLDNGNWGGQDGWLLKFDEDGNKIWSKAYGSDLHEYFTAIQPTKDDNFILCGEITNFRQSSAWMLKVDSDGNEIWSEEYNFNDQLSLNSIYPTADGGYLAVGTLSTMPGVIINDGWILRTDEYGKKIWSAQYGSEDSDYLYSISSIKDGEYVIAGYTHGDADNIPSLGNVDGWVIKITESYNISFNNNGGTGTINPLSLKYQEQEILPINTFKKENYHFKGWATTKTKANQGLIDYKDNEKYILEEAKDQVLYAVWEKVSTEKYIIQYNGNKNTSGKVPKDTNKYEKNATAIILGKATLKKEGYEFIGWNTKANGKGKSYLENDKTKITEDIILYAQWKLVDSKVPDTGNNFFIYGIVGMLIGTTLIMRNIKKR